MALFISCLIYSSPVYQACAKFIMKELFNTQLLKSRELEWKILWFSSFQTFSVVPVCQHWRCRRCVEDQKFGLRHGRDLSGQHLPSVCQPIPGTAFTQVIVPLQCIVLYWVVNVIHCVMCAWLFQQAPMPRLSPHIPAGNLYPGYHPILAAAC